MPGKRVGKRRDTRIGMSRGGQLLKHMLAPCSKPGGTTHPPAMCTLSQAACQGIVVKELSHGMPANGDAASMCALGRCHVGASDCLVGFCRDIKLENTLLDAGQAAAPTCKHMRLRLLQERVRGLSAEDAVSGTPDYIAPRGPAARPVRRQEGRHLVLRRAALRALHRWARRAQV